MLWPEQGLHHSAAPLVHDKPCHFTLISLQHHTRAIAQGGWQLSCSKPLPVKRCASQHRHQQLPQGVPQGVLRETRGRAISFSPGKMSISPPAQNCRHAALTASKQLQPLSSAASCCQGAVLHVRRAQLSQRTRCSATAAKLLGGEAHRSAARLPANTQP